MPEYHSHAMPTYNKTFILLHNSVITPLEHGEEEFHVELRGPFFNDSYSNFEKLPIAKKTFSDRTPIGKRTIYKKQGTLNASKKHLNVFNSLSSSESATGSEDNLDHSIRGNHHHYHRSRWEEDRSKIFRHKLQEGYNLLSKISGEDESLSEFQQQKSSVFSSVDKAHHLHHGGRGVNPSWTTNNGNYAKHPSSPSVILYSYQNPPLSLPPSGGYRKHSGHSSLPVEFRPTLIKTPTLPPIGQMPAAEMDENCNGNQQQILAPQNVARHKSAACEGTTASEEVSPPPGRTKEQVLTTRQKLSSESYA